ncbi:MAG: 5-(carboxyamino)imidazole ribonucleotide mutase [Desulfuromonadaceae bacterium]|nr:5-(carboxyamino)imidazole ribonucleotide mutase [Desulfuromonadaceae bacterium]MDD5106968.1 5-(carboxyamino)imidazole ribonucleotide mutase [Desulfuromonadaceae bacterium]
MTQAPLVLLMMGSDTDLPIMQEAANILREFEIPYEVRISSAHRSPARTMALASEASGRGIRIIIAGAGMAAHLAGVVASKTILPVIGVPMPGGALNGVDALYATVQMPGGIPVATMAIGKAGAKNAGLFAVQILALSEPSLVKALVRYRADMDRELELKDAELQLLHTGHV